MRLVGHLTVCAGWQRGRGQARPGALGPPAHSWQAEGTVRRGAGTWTAQSAGTFSQKPTVAPGSGDLPRRQGQPSRAHSRQKRRGRGGRRASARPSAPHTFVKHLLCAGFHPCRGEHTRAPPQAVSSVARESTALVTHHACLLCPSTGPLCLVGLQGTVSVHLLGRKSAWVPHCPGCGGEAGAAAFLTHRSI